MVPVLVSVAVIVWLPAVTSVAPLLKPSTTVGPSPLALVPVATCDNRRSRARTPLPVANGT